MCLVELIPEVNTSKKLELASVEGKSGLWITLEGNA